MPSRPLSPDRTLEVRLHTWSGTCASDVARGLLPHSAAVATLALVAPCRSDVVATVQRRVGAVPSREMEWPPRSVQLALLRSTKQVTLGHVRLTGPGGVTVHHVTYTDELGRTRRVLRLTRHGTHVADHPTVTALAKDVDLTTLRETP